MSSKTDHRTPEEIWEDAKLWLQCVAFPVVCFLFGVLLGYCEGVANTIKWSQSEAIARGVAGYDEKTGEWKWLVERKVAE